MKLDIELFAFYVPELILVMRDEIATTMRLLGVTRLDQLGPHLVSPSTILHMPTFKHFPFSRVLEDWQKTRKRDETKIEIEARRP